MDKSYFSKQVLTRYVQTECERQLFLDLARQKPDLWLKPIREIEKPIKLHKGSENLEKLGKEYEQLVYSQLISLKDVLYKKDSNNDIATSGLDIAILDNIYNILHSRKLEYLIFLEAQYENPTSFFKDLFDMRLGDPDNAVPIEFLTNVQIY